MKKTFKAMPRIWMWALLLILPGVASGLRLLNVSGPSVVVNGSTPLLVLDCEYELSERDKHGLVVKWYFNRNPFPSYQWIPNNLPQDLGVLKGRIDLNYHVSDDPFMKHRALAIRNPTIDLTGEYTCWISSFTSEAMERKNLIVYSPAEDLLLTWTKPTDISVLVLCKASGVYPEPHIALFRSDDTTHRNLMDGADVRLSQDEAGYSVSVQLELYDYELEEETVFKCELKIPGTDYQVQEEIHYYPAPDYDYERDDERLHHLDDHPYYYDLQKRQQGGAPTTTSTTTSTTTTSTSTSTPTKAAFVAAMDDNNNVLLSTKAAFVAAMDDNNNVNELNDEYIGNDLPDHPSNDIDNMDNDINIDSVSKAESMIAEEIPRVADIVNKENDINIDSVSKAESVVAEESPRVAESVSGGTNTSWSVMLLCSLILLQNILQ